MSTALMESTLILNSLCEGAWKQNHGVTLLMYELQKGHFDEDDLPDLIRALRLGQPFGKPYVRFYCESDRLQVEVTDPNPIGVNGFHWGSDAPLQDDLGVLEELYNRYLRVLNSDLRPEQELFAVLGDSTFAQLIVLEFLARTQKVTDPEVAKCWWMLVEGIGSQGVPAEQIEGFVRSGGALWDATGINDFVMENVENNQTQVSFVLRDCFCPTDAWYRELKKLLSRYYDAI